jgi:hypothetical protein
MILWSVIALPHVRASLSPPSHLAAVIKRPRRSEQRAPPAEPETPPPLLKVESSLAPSHLSYEEWVSSPFILEESSTITACRCEAHLDRDVDTLANFRAIMANISHLPAADRVQRVPEMESFLHELFNMGGSMDRIFCVTFPSEGSKTAAKAPELQAANGKKGKGAANKGRANAKGKAQPARSTPPASRTNTFVLSDDDDDHDPVADEEDAAKPRSSTKLADDSNRATNASRPNGRNESVQETPRANARGVSSTRKGAAQKRAAPEERKEQESVWLSAVKGMIESSDD